MPFGVELPENLGSSTDQGVGGGDSQGAPEGASPPSGTQISSEGQGTQIPRQPLDLDKLERFRFNGRDWTPSDFRKDYERGYMLQGDYSRKTRELAETRKFADNFAHDLRTVIADRNQLDEFKRIYPREFVEICERILEQMPHRQPTQQPQPPGAVDPKWAERLSRVEGQLGHFQQATEQAQVEQIQGWLNNHFDVLSRKYPYADAEVINSRALEAAQKGTQITETVLDKLFKQHNEQVLERKAGWDKAGKEKATQQIAAGKRARDMGPGGGPPSGAPKSPKTMKEAKELWLQDIAARKG